MNFPEVYSATGMMGLIQQIGFLPLLDSGIEGFSAEDIVAEDCGYVRLFVFLCFASLQKNLQRRQNILKFQHQ